MGNFFRFLILGSLQAFSRQNSGDVGDVGGPVWGCGRERGIMEQSLNDCQPRVEGTTPRPDFRCLLVPDFGCLLVMIHYVC